MDPLTISATVLGIAGKCVTVARDLSILRDKYTHASLTISAICSESAVVNAALCKLQSLFSQPQDEGFVRFQSRPELASACDTALTGCTLLYSCLDDEVQSLRIQAPANATVELTWSQKSKVVWKDATMKELLQQIRGQTSALNLLLQCFHFEHALETRHLLMNQGEAISQIKTNMSVLRSAYPSKQNMPESVLGDTRPIQAVFADNASVIGDSEFSFDDLVVNSRAYRQAMAAAMSYAKDQASRPQDVPDDGSSGSTSNASHDTVKHDNGTGRMGEGISAFAAPVDASTIQSGQGQQSQWPSEPVPHHRLDDRFLRAFALPSPGTSVTSYQNAVEWQQLLEYEGLTKEDVLEEPKQLIEFQNVWFEVLSSEREHIRLLKATKTIFMDQILLRWPKVVQEPQKFVDEVFGNISDLVSAHVEHLYQPLVQHWAVHGAWAPFTPEPFQNLLRHASDLMLQYCSNYHRAVRRLTIESQLNTQFYEFIKVQRAHPEAMRLDWGTFLKAPITRFLRYSLLLYTLNKLNLRLPHGYRRSQKSPRLDIGLVDRQLSQLSEQIRQLMIQTDTLTSEADNDVNRTEFIIRMKPREYLTHETPDTSWYRPGMKMRCQIPAFCQIKQPPRDPYWAWCEAFVIDQHIVLAEAWKWATPTERRVERDSPLCALSIKMVINRVPEDVYHGGVKSRRKHFGLFSTSVPREAGESALVMTYRVRQPGGSLETQMGQVVLTGKTRDISWFAKCTNADAEIPEVDQQVSQPSTQGS